MIRDRSNVAAAEDDNSENDTSASTSPVDAGPFMLKKTPCKMNVTPTSIGSPTLAPTLEKVTTSW